MCSARRRKRTSNGNNRLKKVSPPGFLFSAPLSLRARRFLSLRGGRSPTRQSVFFLHRLPVNRCRGGRLCPPETFPLRGRWQREALTDEVSLRASAHAGVGLRPPTKKKSLSGFLFCVLKISSYPRRPSRPETAPHSRRTFPRPHLWSWGSRSCPRPSR